MTEEREMKAQLGEALGLAYEGTQGSQGGANGWVLDAVWRSEGGVHAGGAGEGGAPASSASDQSDLQ